MIEPPDPRVLQANERTLLAWIRTGLAAMAFGFVLERSEAIQGLVAQHRGGGRSAIALLGVALVVLGAVANVVATVDFLRVRRAIVRGEIGAPAAVGGPALAAVVSIAGLALAALLIAR